MTHLLLWGNAYAQIIRNGKSEVVALYPLMPNRVTVDRDEHGKLYYKYQTSDDEAHTMKGSLVRLSPKDVLHIPGLGFDGLVGYSPIAMAKNSIGMTMAAEEYGAKFFANGATPGGILEHPGVVKDPERVCESWNSAFGGSANSNKVAVLEEGISRFSRNTVDSIEIVRKLCQDGIYIYFEKENINTLDAKGEVLMTIMAALAQQESESLSANVRLGIQFRN